MHFNNFAEGGRLENVFGGGAWWERGGQFLEIRFRVFRDSNHKSYFANSFYLTVLLDLLFTCRLKDVVLLVIFCLCFYVVSFY